MPTRSQRHLVAVGREASNGQGVDYDPGVITSFTAVGGLGNAKFSVTPGAGCDRVNVYRVPAGGTLDKAVHPMIPSFCTPNLPMTFYDGDPAVVNLAAGIPQLGRQWTFFPGTYGDNFDRADANLEASPGMSGGGSWVHDGAIAGALTISSSAVVSNTTDTLGSAYKTPPLGSADHYVQGTYPANTANSLFLCCRLADRNNYLAFRISSALWEVYKRVGGTLTGLATSQPAAAAGDTFRLEASGSTWTVRRNGTVVGTGPIDAALTSDGTGIVARNAAGSRVDNFMAGTLVASAKYTHAATNLENRLMTSLDGINWMGGTVPTDASPQQWFSVCWSPELNLFCAVAAAGGTVTTARAMTSPDGANWTVRTLATQVWRSVCWGGAAGQKKFVAVSSSAVTTNVYYSIDGITWTAAPSKGNTNNIRGVCWSEERQLFVAVGDTGTNNRAFTSPDGINWTVQATPSPDVSWMSVCYGNGKFVAVGASGSTERVMTSPNGTTWTLAPGTETIVAWQSVCFSPELNRFVMVGNSGSAGVARIWYSDDGITWVPSDMTGGYGWAGVCWAKELSLFVAVNNTSGTTRVATSPNGINWTVRSNLPNGPTWQGVCWSPTLGKFVGVGQANGVSYEKLWWPGAGAKAGENWRYGVTVSDGTTLGASGAIQATFGNPGWEPFTITNSFGNATRRSIKVPAADEGWVGFSVSTDAAVALSAPIIFKENYKCAPQGTFDYYPFPATRSGVEGPGFPVVAGVVIT
jgi:hypothetical protein